MAQRKGPVERKEFLMADKNALGVHFTKEQFDVLMDKMTTHAREASSTAISKSSAAAGATALELFADIIAKTPVQANVSSEERSTIEVTVQAIVEKARGIAREMRRLVNPGA
jgi:hypothetical protein